ncbi:MAG: hypothetical protein PHS53_05060, partial [Candidatus Pacebacteria bacterium]|nr:hypothetical protein [Candidatus Paceibacterota bacterium]
QLPRRCAIVSPAEEKYLWRNGEGGLMVPHLHITPDSCALHLNSSGNECKAGAHVVFFRLPEELRSR